MKINKKLLSLVVLVVIALSFFLIKKQDVSALDNQTNKPLLYQDKKSLLHNSKPPTKKYTPKNTGKIISIQRGGGYSFIEVELPSKKILILASAELPNKFLIGNDIQWDNPRLSKNYYSHALKTNFESLYMVTIKNKALKSGVITSIKIVDGITFLSVKQERSDLELIVKSERILDELLVGTKIEWQQETISSNNKEHSKSNNALTQSPLMVDWIRHSKN